ncbi:MAG: hypothetical protein HYX50_03020 [Chloroflexi bacterium]|nr:hypothetical protein [Chloroflexota bacterium]
MVAVRELGGGSGERPRRGHLRIVPPTLGAESDTEPEPRPFALVRRDTLPEHTEYRDTGCALSPSCLRCPLPRCQFDEHSGARRMVTARRDSEIALLRRRYRAPIDLLAQTYGLSRRSIFRILKEHVRGPKEVTHG